MIISSLSSFSCSLGPISTLGESFILITSKFSRSANESGNDFKSGFLAKDKNLSFFKLLILSGISLTKPSMCRICRSWNVVNFSGNGLADNLAAYLENPLAKEEDDW